MTTSKGSFHSILGSDDWGWYVSESDVVVHRDISVSGLRIREVSRTNSQCVNGRYRHIELEGNIGPDSTEIIRRIVSKMPKCVDKVSGKGVSKVVYMSSGGGYLIDGIELGRFFREQQINTRLANGQQCASSCAVAYLGGTYRDMASNSNLIYHAPYLHSFSGIDCSDQGQVKILKDYFNSMLGKENGEYLISRTLSYCSTNDGWTINKDAAQIFGILK
jgi:hypothetical protein